MSRLRELLAEAAESLSRAGVSSPQVDAEELAAHLLGVSRTQLRFTEAAADFPGDIEIWWHSARGAFRCSTWSEVLLLVPSKCAWAPGCSFHVLKQSLCMPGRQGSWRLTRRLSSYVPVLRRWPLLWRSTSRRPVSPRSRSTWMP